MSECLKQISGHLKVIFVWVPRYRNIAETGTTLAISKVLQDEYRSSDCLKQIEYCALIVRKNLNLMAAGECMGNYENLISLCEQFHEICLNLVAFYQNIAIMTACSSLGRHIQSIGIFLELLCAGAWGGHSMRLCLVLQKRECSSSWKT